MFPTGTSLGPCSQYWGQYTLSFHPAFQGLTRGSRPVCGAALEAIKLARSSEGEDLRKQLFTNAELFRAIAPLAPWTKNYLIQYTGDGVGPQPHTVQGLQNGADLNAFNGTREDLLAAWPGAPRAVA